MGILAVEGSHVRDTGSTLSQLQLPVWSCSDAATAALGVRGHLKRTRIQATLPWLAAAASTGAERRAACCTHAAVFHLGAGSWTASAMAFAIEARDGAAAAAKVLTNTDIGICLTHAVHALCLPLKHTHHVMCSVALDSCDVARLPCGVRALGAVRVSAARCSFTACGAGIDHVMTSRAAQRSTEIPHSALLPAAWVSTLDVRACKFDASGGGGNACAVRCRWLCLIERLRPGTKPTPIIKLPKQQQPLLAAIGNSALSSPRSSAAALPVSAAAKNSTYCCAPVMIHACSFVASGIEFVGSVAELPVAFARQVFHTFDEAVAEASAWSAGRARADSAWAAAVVSQCTFNGLHAAEHASALGTRAADVATPAQSAAAAAVAVSGVCVRVAADVVLAVCDCVFAGHAPTRHAVSAARAASLCAVPPAGRAAFAEFHVRVP